MRWIRAFAKVSWRIPLNPSVTLSVFKALFSQWLMLHAEPRSRRGSQRLYNTKGNICLLLWLWQETLNQWMRWRQYGTLFLSLSLPLSPSLSLFLYLSQPSGPMRHLHTPSFHMPQTPQLCLITYSLWSWINNPSLLFCFFFSLPYPMNLISNYRRGLL